MKEVPNAGVKEPLRKRERGGCPRLSPVPPTTPQLGAAAPPPPLYPPPPSTGLSACDQPRTHLEHRVEVFTSRSPSPSGPDLRVVPISEWASSGTVGYGKFRSIIYMKALQSITQESAMGGAPGLQESPGLQPRTHLQQRVVGAVQHQLDHVGVQDGPRLDAAGQVVPACGSQGCGFRALNPGPRMGPRRC